MFETLITETIDHCRRGFGSNDATVIAALKKLGVQAVLIKGDCYLVCWEPKDGQPKFFIYAPNQRLFPDRELVHGEGVHC